MMKVDFFIVGQPKSGTTALANFLSQHPDVCMADPKEPGYFAKDLIKESDEYHGYEHYPFVRDKKTYEQYFSHKEQGQLTGEASTNYLYSKTAAELIKKHNPKAKIIILLRNPVDFMYSMHMQFFNETHEDELNFETALDYQEARLKGKKMPKQGISPGYYQYKQWANYREQIDRYVQKFGHRSILILINEDFKKDNEKQFKKVAKFLEIDPSFKPKFEIVHGSKKPRSTTLNRHLNNPNIKRILLKLLGLKGYRKIRQVAQRIIMKPQNRQDLNPDTRAKLEVEFKTEVRQLSKEINTDLSKVWF